MAVRKARYFVAAPADRRQARLFVTAPTRRLAAGRPPFGLMNLARNTRSIVLEPSDVALGDALSRGVLLANDRRSARCRNKSAPHKEKVIDSAFTSSPSPRPRHRDVSRLRSASPWPISSRSGARAMSEQSRFHRGRAVIFCIGPPLVLRPRRSFSAAESSLTSHRNTC